MPDTIADLESKLAETTGTPGKIDLLNQIAFALYPTDPARGATTARKALQMAKKIKDQERIACSLNRTGICSWALSDYPKALEYFHEALRVSTAGGSGKEEANALQNIGMIHCKLSEHPKAIEYFSRSIELRRSLGQVAELATNLGNMAIAYSQIGDHTNGLKYNYMGLEIAEQSGRQADIAMACGNIATSYLVLLEQDKAIEYAQRGLEIYSALGNTRGVATLLTQVAGVHHRRGELDRALELLDQVLEHARQLADRSIESNTLGHMGMIHRQSGRTDTALEHLYAALELADRIHLLPGIAFACQTIGSIYLDAGRFNEAYTFLDRALVTVQQSGERQREHVIHEIFSRYYEETGNPAKALHHYRLYSQIKEEVLGHEQQQAIARMQMRAEIERAEKEREILRLEKEQLQREMEHKAKELAAMALRLVEKKEFLGSLKEEIGSVSTELDTTGRLKVRKLLREIEGNVTDDTEWQTFERQFEAVHHDFLRELSQRHGNLTPTELKVCALLKLGLASKEIAGILSLEVRAIESYRYRIRKKLKLEGDTNLANYFAAYQVS